MKVAIVYGGYSSEKDASTENAHYINEALKECGYETHMVPYGKNLVGTLRSLDTDMVYVCVQGKGHGDGTIQAILEQEGIPFTGSGSHAAAIINDKILCKLLFNRCGIRTPRWQMLTKEEFDKGAFDADGFGYPFVAKAPSEGGSFGIALIRNKQELSRINEVFSYESPILIEEFVPGSFYTVGILERDGEITAFPCVKGVEIQDGRDMDDPESLKVFTGDYGVREADLPGELLSQMADMAKKIFRLTGAEDVARIDFMVSEKDGLPYTLEINAVPGLKPRSLLPGEARAAKLSYRELVEGILLSAWKKTKAGEK